MSISNPKLQAEQILVASDKRSNGKPFYRFWEVVRATTNTCEILELRSQVLRQIGDVQEITPWLKNYVEDKPLRFKTSGKMIIMGNNLIAIPWDGRNRFQQALIYFAD
jgi:hypothetical protein